METQINMEDLMRKIDRLRDRIDELEDHAHCDNCGGVIESDAQFCSDECIAESEGKLPSPDSPLSPAQPNPSSGLGQNRF